MVTVTAAVGTGQTNTRHDVAVVQAALKSINRTTGLPFLAGTIDGRHGPTTQGAINAFQAVHGADAAPAPAGVIRPGGATIAALTAALPVARRDMRALTGQSVVYLAGSAIDATNSANGIRANAALRTGFRNRLAAFVSRAYGVNGLVLRLTGNGARRTFAEQAAISPPASYSGPGESNHNYGNAADLGFRGMQWLRPNGTMVTDNDWLVSLEGFNAAAAGAFWDARDALARMPPTSFFTLSFERIHLQSFDQGTMSSGRSLAAHLTRSGVWNWQATRYDRTNRDWFYSCDLGGVNGTFVEVGTSNQIFAGNATVTAAKITAAGWVRPGSATAPPPVSSALPGNPAAPGPVAASLPITATDVAAVRAALLAEFTAADTNWANWTVVP